MVRVMVNERLTGECAMTATLKFLHQFAEAVFTSQMQRAAVKISARQHVFHRHGA
jgi:hypothetical protein